MGPERDLFGMTASPSAARRAGRRVHLPGVLRAKAEAMRAAGASVEAIAGAIGVCSATVRNRLQAELERGMPGGRPPGRPQWQPTAEERQRVAKLAAQRVPQEQIAEAVGCSAPTLRRHCRLELSGVRDG